MAGVEGASVSSGNGSCGGIARSCREQAVRRVRGWAWRPFYNLTKFTIDMYIICTVSSPKSGYIDIY